MAIKIQVPVFFLALFKIESGDDDVEEFASRTQQTSFFGGNTHDDIMLCIG